MHRNDTPDRDVDLFGVGKDGYKDGSPPGSSSTATDKDTFNALQEELAGIVEGSGETLLKTDLTQVFRAIQFMQDINALANWTLRADSGVAMRVIATDDIDGLDSVITHGSATNGQRSTDGGLTWATITGQSQATIGIAYGNSQWIAVGTGAVNIQSSANGTTWVSENTGTGTGQSVVWDETLSLWCVVGDDTGSWIVTSPDGLAWTVRSAVGSSTFRGVASNGTLFVAVGDSGTIETSVDGINWIARTAAGGYSANFQGVVWTGKSFIAVGDATASDGEVQTSVDGITWVQSSIIGSGNVSDLFLVGGIAVARAGLSLYMNHGRAGGVWKLGPTKGQPGTGSVTGMGYSLGRTVVVENVANIYTSHLYGTLTPS